MWLRSLALVIAGTLTLGAGACTGSDPVAGGGEIREPRTKGCGNRRCEPGETANNCASDCSDDGSTCGDGNCDQGEDACGCAADCTGTCCGNGSCDPGESCESCARDCGKCMDPEEPAPTCGSDCGCAAADSCDGVAPAGCFCDAACTSWGDCCPDACSICGSCGGPVCGDGVCESDETVDSCPSDCGCEATTCDDEAPGGCWCDAACVSLGDCCADACSQCGAC